MATRASIVMKEEGKPILSVYKHWDGYPSGLGKSLEEIVMGGQITNGLGINSELGKVFNGAGCLFASIISILKDKPGDVYITSLDSVGNSGEEYIYEIDVNGKDVQLTHKENR
jgi:hypothetical protein